MILLIADEILSNKLSFLKGQSKKNLFNVFRVIRKLRQRKKKSSSTAAIIWLPPWIKPKKVV